MTALAHERKTPQLGILPVPEFAGVSDVGVKGGKIIYAGGIVVLNTATGYAEPASTATGLIVLGKAEQTVDNTLGADGALKIRAKTGVFPMLNSASADLIHLADIGKDCYLVDDQTVALTNGSGTRSRAGVINWVDADGLVYVLLGVLGSAPGAGAGLPTIQTGTTTLVSGTKTVNSGISITSGSKVFVTLNTPGGSAIGTGYKVPDASLVVGGPGTGAFTVTSVASDKSTVTTDTSTVNYLIVG